MQESAVTSEITSRKVRDWESQVVYVCVDTPQKFAETLTYLKEKRATRKYIAIDTETTGLSYVRHQLVGMSFSVEPNNAFYIPVRHQGYKNLPEDLYLKIYTAIIELGYETVFFNASFDLHMISKDMGNWNLPVNHDVQAQLKLRNSNEYFHALKDSVQRWLNVDMIRFEENFPGKKKDQFNFAELNPYDILNYAAADADMTLRLHELFGPQVEPLNENLVAMQGYVYNLEMKLVKALCRQEKAGVRLNVNRLAQEKVRLMKEQDEIGKFFLAQAGLSPDTEVGSIVNSPQKLSQLFFETLKIKVPKAAKVTKKGFVSVDKSLKAILARDNPVVAAADRWKKLDTFCSRYLESLPNAVSVDGKIHTQYNSFDAKTGRLSSSQLVKEDHEGTNLQQIAKPVEAEEEGEDDYNVRAAFEPDPGYYFLDVDYAQIEYKVMAGFAKERSVIEGFKRGVDYHTLTAATTFNVPFDKVDAKQRKLAKTLNFALNYGAGYWTIAQRLQIPELQAKQLVDSYWNGLSRIRAYKQELVEAARKTGFVATYRGRLRDVSGVNTKGDTKEAKGERAFWERTVASHMIQGSCADFMKESIVKVDEFCYGEGKDLGMIPVMNIHDELLLMVPADKDPKEMFKVVYGLMVIKGLGDCPTMGVEGEFGPNWGEMNEIVVEGIEKYVPAASVQIQDVSLPKDSTVGAVVVPYNDSMVTKKEMVIVSTEKGDPKLFEAFAKICEYFPGTYSVVVGIQDKVVKTKFSVDPNNTFREYVQKIFGADSIHVFGVDGEEVIAAAILQDIKWG